MKKNLTTMLTLSVLASGTVAPVGRMTLPPPPRKVEDLPSDTFRAGYKVDRAERRRRRALKKKRGY